MSNIILQKLVEDEAYCCMYGYLKLCRARGEKPLEMAKNMGVAYSTIRYHYTLLNEGKKSHRCKACGDCLLPVVEELRKKGQ